MNNAPEPPNADPCPQCNGSGRIFIPVSDDQRRERVCQLCKGYGAQYLLMEAILTGAYVAPKPFTDESKKPIWGAWGGFA